jgi:hypothetical protein
LPGLVVIAGWLRLAVWLVLNLWHVIALRLVISPWPLLVDPVTKLAS